MLEYLFLKMIQKSKEIMQMMTKDKHLRNIPSLSLKLPTLLLFLMEISELPREEEVKFVQDLSL